MKNKKFIIIRYVLIVLTCISLLVIEIYQKKNNNIVNEENEAIVKAKEYVNNNDAYFNEMFKENDMEYRLDTDILFKKNNEYKGYINIINNEYSYINEENLLIDKIIDNNSLTKTEFNEDMPFDLDYVYRGEDPNNYIKYNENIYRIIGITNSSDLKIISIDNYNNITWGKSNDINYFKGEELEKEDSIKGIFYVGYIRSETNDLESIVKNEKRNNNYTISNPKYYGYYSFVNVSDIISASDSCTFNNILEINTENCNSYLIDMLDNSYTANTLENNKVYRINENKEIISSLLEDNIQTKKVIYVHGISKYVSGDGTKENPYEFEN